MAKIRKAKANFMGAGAKVASEDGGFVPNDNPGMGIYYGRGLRNPMGKMRGDSLGYIPATKKQLGTPPKTIV